MGTTLDIAGDRGPAAERSPQRRERRGRGRAWTVLVRPRLPVFLLPGATAVAYVMLGWSRRWTLDDAFINYRVVKQIEAGNGPVFNTGERVEVATSTAWLVILTIGDLLSPLSIEWTALVLQLAFGVAGLLLGMAGALRLADLRRGTGSTGWVLPVGAAAFFALMEGSEAVEAAAGAYFRARIWGAPAALALFAVSGLLIGLGHSRALLLVQLLLNGLNAALDIWCAGALGLGARGIGLGTAIAEWVTCVVALAIAVRVLRARHRDGGPWLDWPRIVDTTRLRQALAANGDILVRTLCLLAAFGWFANAGARFGDVTLAANHLLLQLVAFSAFFLDGFAFVAEARTGAAWGARDRAGFLRAVRLTSDLALAAAALLALGILVAGLPAVEALTTLTDVRRAAVLHLPWAALYVFLSVAAFQLDGVFIGTTRTRDMRNAAVLSSGLFVLLAWPAATLWGNHGLWAAFVAYVTTRALALWPGYRRMCGALPAT